MGQYLQAYFFLLYKKKFVSKTAKDIREQKTGPNKYAGNI